MEIDQTLVDYLITAAEEEDVLFTHYWLNELREKGQLPRALEQTHSWKGLTPLEVAASRPASQYSKLNLEMVLLSGAKISISAAKKARDAKNAEALLIMGGWYQIRIRMALEARQLVDMNSEDAAEWVDKHLPSHPNANSFTGYGELPARPPSLRTPPPSTSSSKTLLPPDKSAEPLSKLSTSAPSFEHQPPPPSQQLYRFTLSDCPLTLSQITINYLVGRVSGYDITWRSLDESTEITFLLRGKDMAEKAFAELDGLKLQGEPIRAEYVRIAEQRERKGGKEGPRKIQWEGKQRKRSYHHQEASDPLKQPAAPHIPSINLEPCRSKQTYRGKREWNEQNETELEEPDTLLVHSSRPPPSKKPKLSFNLRPRTDHLGRASVVVDKEALAAPSEFANGKLEVRNENLAIFEQGPEWPEVRDQVEKSGVGWKGIGEGIRRGKNEVDDRLGD